MDNKKGREELHKTIWKIANELRGSVDGWDFKQYVLGFLFYRFISENLANYINKLEPDTNFDYATLPDDQAEYGRNETLKEKGFYILPSELFINVRKKAKKDKDLNITLNNIFNNIENSAKGTDSEDDMKGLFDDIDVNSNKLGNTVSERNNKLVKLLDAVGDLPLGNYSDNTIDVFGDAYEFLMTMYASSAGKSGGEFFTPQEVGELLARIVLMDKREVNKVYDPCCGSGGLLLKFAKILGRENIKQGFFGQEINLTTYNLARINMFLHDINYNKFNIALGDTLLNPKHWDDEPFDAIISNPPYSIKWAGKSNPLLINDERFSPAGILAPESKADLAFTMHMLSWLSAKGTAAIVEFPGILYREDSKNEPAIRKYLVDNNYVDMIIQLSSDMFFGTNSATCILVLKKNKDNNNILFIDASDERSKNENRMKKATNKFKLSEENINNILELIKERKNVDNKSIVVKYEDIVKNNYNLAVNIYLSRTDKISKKRRINEIENDVNSVVIEQNYLKNKINIFIDDYKKNIKKEINKLINNNNIRIVQISDVCDVYTGGEAPDDFIRSKKPKGEYQYPIYSNGAGENAIYGYSKKCRINKRAVTVSSIGTIGYHTIREANFTPVIRLKTLVPKNDDVLDVEFLNYILDTISFMGTNATLSSMNSNKIKKTKIMLPDIQTQKYIVKKLNEFEQLEDKVVEILQNEISYRKEQKYYYKNDILSFEEESNE